MAVILNIEVFDFKLIFSKKLKYFFIGKILTSFA